MAVFSIFPKIPGNGRFVHLANCRPLVTFTNLFRKAKSVSEYANHIVNYLGAGSIGHFTPSQVVQFSGATAYFKHQQICGKIMVNKIKTFDTDRVEHVSKIFTVMNRGLD